MLLNKSNIKKLCFECRRVNGGQTATHVGVGGGERSIKRKLTKKRNNSQDLELDNTFLDMIPKVPLTKEK